MANKQEITKAFAYLRTSSATNVGEDKDSRKRQLVAIEAFAKRKGFEIICTFSDDAVSGEEQIDKRPGFVAIMEAQEAGLASVVIVEDASRFARKLFTQEAAIMALKTRGIVCWSVAGELELTDTDDEMRVAIRQVLGAFAQLEKARLVKKLKVARDRKREADGKCEGRKSIAERDGEAVVALARKLHRVSPKTHKRLPLRAIADQLAAAGYVSAAGTAYSPAVVARMLA